MHTCPNCGREKEKPDISLRLSATVDLIWDFVFGSETESEPEINPSCEHCGIEICEYCRTELKEYNVVLCEKCFNKYSANLQSWVGGTRHENLRGYNIVKKIGVIKAEGQYNDPLEIKDVLKIKSLIEGGNAYIEFFWKKNIEYHEEEYQAGTGPRGNPYYQTRRWTTAFFTGHATVVIVNKLGH